MHQFIKYSGKRVAPMFVRRSSSSLRRATRATSQLLDLYPTVPLGWLAPSSVRLSFRYFCVSSRSLCHRCPRDGNPALESSCTVRPRNSVTLLLPVRVGCPEFTSPMSVTNGSEWNKPINADSPTLFQPFQQARNKVRYALSRQLTTTASRLGTNQTLPKFQILKIQYYCCCNCCCCSHISSLNQVRGHRAGSSHSGAEEYPREKTQTTQGGTRIYHS